MINEKEEKRFSRDDVSTKLADLSRSSSSGVDSATTKRFTSLFRTKRPEADSIATQPSVFDDPVTLEVYRPPAAYENAHRFDHTARWTWAEEWVSLTSIQIGNWEITSRQKLVRKIDLRIMLWACAFVLPILPQLCGKLMYKSQPLCMARIGGYVASFS